MHPAFVTLYQRYQEIKPSKSYSIFPAELDNIFIANKSLFDAWLPGSDKYKSPLPADTALKIIKAANIMKFGWFCSTYNAIPSVTEEYKVVFLDDPYVKVLIAASAFDSFATAYNYIIAVPYDKINSLLNAVKTLEANGLWMKSTQNILCSAQSMSPLLWDKQVNVIIQLSKSPYKVVDPSYHNPIDPKPHFHALIQNNLKEHHSCESFVKLFSLMDEIIKLNIESGMIGNYYYGGYNQRGRINIYITMIVKYIPMISGDIDAMIIALDRLIKEDGNSLSIRGIDFFSQSIQLDSIFEILLATPDYDTNADAVQYLRKHIAHKTILAILKNSLLFNNQLVNVFRDILKTQASFLIVNQDQFIRILLAGPPCSRHAKLITLLHGLDVLDVLDAKCKKSWLYLSSEHRELLVMYLKLFKKNNFLVDRVYDALVQNIDKIEASPILSSLPEYYDLITEEMFTNEILVKFSSDPSKPAIEILDGLENILKSVLDTPLELEFRTVNCKPLQIVTEDFIPPPLQDEETDEDEEADIVATRREVAKIPEWMKRSNTSEHGVTATASASSYKKMPEVKEPREYTSKPGWMTLKNHELHSIDYKLLSDIECLKIKHKLGLFKVDTENAVVLAAAAAVDDATAVDVKAHPLA